MLYLHVYLCISSSILSLFFFPSLEEYERAEEELCEEERWKSLYKVIRGRQHCLHNKVGDVFNCKCKYALSQLRVHRVGKDNVLLFFLSGGD